MSPTVHLWLQGLPVLLGAAGLIALGELKEVLGALAAAGLGVPGPVDFQTTGALLSPGWQAEPVLPPVQGSNQTSPVNFTTPVAPVRSPAVARCIRSIARCSGLQQSP